MVMRGGWNKVHLRQFRIEALRSFGEADDAANAYGAAFEGLQCLGDVVDANADSLEGASLA